MLPNTFWYNRGKNNSVCRAWFSFATDTHTGNKFNKYAHQMYV